MKSFLLSAFFGFCALIVLNLLGPYTGVTLPVSRLTLAVTGGLGVPGVTLLVLLDLFL